MFKRLFIFFIFLFPLSQFAQDFSTLWEGYFSYYNIKDVVKGNNKIYAASENAIFSLDIQTNNIEELTTINGLSGETISTIYYSEVYELLIIGYENGLIEIAFDNDDNILTLVDIINKPTIVGTDKRINHFNAYENVVYVSTNYGISVFNLERLEFGDTYFIGNGGSQIQVNQTAIHNGNIYAACMGGNGLRKALISNPNLIDYQNWQTVTSGDFLAIEASANKLYAVRTNKRIYEVVNDALTELFLYSEAPVELQSVNDNLIVTTKNTIFIYDASFNLLSQALVDTSTFNTQFNTASIDSEYIYIGTKDFGVLKTLISSPVSYEEIHPEGPLLNVPFSIEAEPDGLWVTFGEYNLYYNPYPLNSRGFSHLKDDVWINNPYSDVLEAKCLNKIAINPLNTSQVYISSFFSGLLEINEDVPTLLYNETNSGLESLNLPDNPNYIDVRVGASAFDRNGLLWTVTSLINKPLKSFNPNNNQWNSYSFTSVIPEEYGSNLGFGDLVIGSDETKWLASYKFGVIGFNETRGKVLIKDIYKEDENMPSKFVTALALDKRNQLWIGTFKGLRVLYNTSNFFEDNNVEVDEIIIEEDGIAKELLFEQFITDIEVDGSNNKWIATADSGIFYFSSDGQKTIFHFTKDNSPLPSNEIKDVSIDSTNGIVYIATSRGLVSFSAGGSSTFEDLQEAYAYPNPVRPTFNIVEEKVKIKDISENVNIKITDIEGNLVAEAQSRINQRYRGYNLEIDGGTAFWNGKNLANNVVASGVYLVMLSDLDTFETKVLKLMVVR
ncbi:two-component regulator propeller domain-containing protein [Thalassobellus suaedae]|uniref:Two-component regulator propeller domain-containing protein n=1 Tax=Thalassobellus suaedae TaxID=3074124 RepID=A0ABY9Y6F9_9FLAO|nr:two-component regulator propeller domain-containing protein [Flavobacteriaceae bacterium HL-DH10]